MVRLKEKYGLLEPMTPLEAFEKDPCPRTLGCLPKELQTTEMIEIVSANCEAKFDLLKYVSKRALTYEICKRECSKRGTNLKYVPKRFLDSEICLCAVTNCGLALGSVPDGLRSFDMCLAAVENDRGHGWEHALAYVPDSVISSSRGRNLCEVAVGTNSLALRDVPRKYVDRAMARKAIVNAWPGEYREQKPDNEPCWRPARWWPIGYVPESVMDGPLVELSLGMFPDSISCLPAYARKYLSNELCIELIKKDWRCLRHLPEPFCSRKVIVDCALEESPRALGYVPERMRTQARCFEAKTTDPEGVPLGWFPERVLEKWVFLHPEDREELEQAEPSPGMEHLEIAEAPSVMPLQKEWAEGTLSVRDTGKLLAHSIETDLKSAKSVCYISDIHVDHQISFGACSTGEEARALIAPKVDELVSTLPQQGGYILIAGDIADNRVLVRSFYKALSDALAKSPQYFKVISVLGNHELWTDRSSGSETSRSVDEIVDDYKKMFVEEFPSFTLLENQLCVLYKGAKWRVISESDLLVCDESELVGLCEESSTVILGGLGYSGRNPKYNASAGLYRDALGMGDDVVRSDRFCTLYNKLLRCAGDRQVIVLTHSPIQNWLLGAPNPKWIYVNGHTHQNGFIAGGESSTILFDNQVGYEPKVWHFNSFDIEGLYDIFADLEDGVHEITPEIYREFNRSRGINSEYNRAGTPYVVKRDGMHMFFSVRNNKLYMLEGGRIHKAEHPMGWYYERIPEYTARVRAAFGPYERALQQISAEVRSFGGYGTVHGCIVDIDFFNHIYLNPFDGRITPYFALDMDYKEIHRTIEGLLGNKGALICLPFDDGDGKEVLKRYRAAVDAGEITLLSKQRIVGKHEELASVPEVVLDRSMYEPSKIMRSIQYVFDNDVIRIWRDDVLEMGVEAEVSALDSNDSPSRRPQLTSGKQA